MVALSLLAIVLAALVANMSSLTQARDFATEQEQANAILRELVERVQAADMDELGSGGHWSEAVWMTDAVGNPLGGLDRADLAARGIYEMPVSLEDLDVYIEYFRGNDLVENGLVVAPGMMQRPDESVVDYQVRVDRRVLDGANPYRLDQMLPDNSAPVAIGPQVSLDPAVVRISVIWGEGDRRIEVFTARRSEGTN